MAFTVLRHRIAFLQRISLSNWKKRIKFRIFYLNCQMDLFLRTFCVFGALANGISLFVLFAVQFKWLWLCLDFFLVLIAFAICLSIGPRTWILKWSIILVRPFCVDIEPHLPFQLHSSLLGRIKSFKSTVRCSQICSVNLHCQYLNGNKCRKEHFHASWSWGATLLCEIWL